MSFRVTSLLAMLALVCTSSLGATKDLIAFPGAEGFGRRAKSGYTNLEKYLNSLTQ
jgi:hypothetical protein